MLTGKTAQRNMPRHKARFHSNLSEVQSGGNAFGDPEQFDGHLTSCGSMDIAGETFLPTETRMGSLGPRKGRR
jgi:hypothetical protein